LKDLLSNLKKEMSKLFIQKLIFLTVFLILVISGFEGFIRSFYGEFPYDAKSTSESKELGVFIKNVYPSKSEFSYRNGLYNINSSWLQYRAVRRYKFLYWIGYWCPYDSNYTLAVAINTIKPLLESSTESNRIWESLTFTSKNSISEFGEPESYFYIQYKDVFFSKYEVILKNVSDMKEVTTVDFFDKASL